MTLRLDRNAGDQLRLRRNAQRMNDGSMNAAIKVTAPITNSGTIALSLNAMGGLQSSSGLKILLANTSLVLSVSGVGVNLATNPGLTISSGVKLLLADTSLALSVSGVAANLNATGGLQTSSGLSIKLDTNPGLVLASTGLKLKLTDTSLALSSSGVAVSPTTNGGLGVSSGLFVKGFRSLSSAPSMADGDVYFDTTNKWIVYQANGVTFNIAGLLSLTTADQAAVTNTVVNTTVYTYTFPANFFVVSRSFAIHLVGVYSTDKGVSAGGLNPDAGTTLNVSVVFGGTTFYSTGITTMPNNVSNQRFGCDAFTVCRATGASGTFGRDGTFEVELTSTGLNNFFKRAGGLPFTTTATTATLPLTLTIQWGDAHPLNTATVHQIILETFN